MGFREYLDNLEKEGKLVRVKEPVSKKLEASGIIKELDDKPVLFEKIKESEFRGAGNIFPTKDSIADYFGITAADLIPKMVNAIENPSKPEVVTNAILNNSLSPGRRNAFFFPGLEHNLQCCFFALPLPRISTEPFHPL